MRYLLSIIIPFYNSDIYLDSCLGSISLISDDIIEVILVDDGSTDNSFLTASKYYDKIKNMTILQKNNGGVSSARNLGIKHASGKYIFFCDSDDLIIPELFKEAIESLNENFELYLFDYFVNYQRKRFAYILNTKYDLICTVVNQLNSEPWKKIFMTSIIKNNDIKFKENLNLGEDAVFFLDYVRIINDFCYVKQAFYNYYLNPNGTCSRVREDYFDQYIFVHKYYREFIEEIELQHLYSVLDNRLISILFRYVAALKEAGICSRRISRILDKEKLLITDTSAVSLACRIKKILLRFKSYGIIKMISKRKNDDLR